MFKLKNAIALLIFILLSVFITQPSNYVFNTYEIGQVSDKNVFAPKYVKYKDEMLSKQLLEDAQSSVQKVYDLDKTIHEKTSSDLSDFILSLKEEKKFINSEVIKQKNTKETNKTFNEEKFIQNELTKVDNPFGFTAEELRKFYNLSEQDLNMLSEAFDNELKIVFDNTIDEANIEMVKRDFVNNTNFYFINKDVRNLMTNKLKEKIVINLTFNEEETEKRIVEALSKVEPVYREVQKGETIIRIGEVITSTHMEKLENLGLIKTEINYHDMLKILPYNAFLLIVLHFYIYIFNPSVFNQFRQYLFLFASIVFGILITNLIKDSSFFLIPLLTILMLVVVFWGKKLTLFTSLIIGMLINVGDYEYLIISIFSGILLTLLFKRRGNRIDLILSGIFVGFGLAFLSFISSFVLEANYEPEKIFYIISSSFASSLLTMGFIPLFETMLGLVTSLKLHELYNPNHPLLKRLIREAPGTYHHSLMVGNLAETAAEEIGANGLLLRVGAFFHDVGKLRNPEFFIENTTPSRNPHDNIDALESAKIIKRHPIDSVELCKKHDIPEPILKLIISHHGDSLVKFFYNKAKSDNPNVLEDDFRYTTPTPKTKEEGILLLADTIEAFSRTIMNKPKDEFEDAIKGLIYSKIQDGTLRNCELSLKDIDTIVYTFVNYLLNSNHERISYKN